MRRSLFLLLGVVSGTTSGQFPVARWSWRHGRAVQEDVTAPNITATYGCGSILTVIVGDGDSSSSNRAQAVWIEERTTHGDVIHRMKLREYNEGGVPACTLAVASSSNTAGDSWFYGSDGLPSISADGSAAMLMCFDIDVGGEMSMNAPKVVAVIHPDRSVSYSGGLSDAYIGIYSTPGIRQVASIDGATGFWMSGVGESGW